MKPTLGVIRRTFTCQVMEIGPGTLVPTAFSNAFEQVDNLLPLSSSMEAHRELLGQDKLSLAIDSFHSHGLISASQACGSKPDCCSDP